MQVNRDIICSFVTKLASIGIDIELAANYPWIYLTKVNGVSPAEKFMARHGFACFIVPVNPDDPVRFSDRRKVFVKIREIVG